MKEFIGRLGKVVQTLWNKIFSKKKQRKNATDAEQPYTLSKCTLGPGEIFIDGQSFGKVQSITSLNKDEVPTEQWDSLMSLFGLGCGDGEIKGGWVEIPSKPEMDEKFFNIPLTFSPKRYRCKTLIITLAADQPYDYKAVDMSQYEERSLIHYIIGSTSSPEEITQEYKNETGDDDEELELLWSDNLCSAVVGEATLCYYEDLDYWEVDYD